MVAVIGSMETFSAVEAADIAIIIGATVDNTANRPPKITIKFCTGSGRFKKPCKT